MLLKSIDIQGFKSFADKTHLQFGNGITAVVGPNGSGKSNISDAVRWVLGEQSTKSLRGASMEDVIFLGSDTRRPQGFAEVTLTIDNTDRSLNFDNDTVSVTRRYYRSHESEYLINGISVRLRDVNELFMDTGLGRDGYSMIGQGKIDSIVGAKPNERRDIFEEASGISRYRYRKIEAERKLNQAEENMVRLRDIFAELESRIEPLRKQSEKAEKYLKFRDKRKELEVGLWMYALNNSKDVLRNHERKLDLAKAQYEEINQKLNEISLKQEESVELNVKYTTEIEESRNRAAEYEESAARTQGEIAVEHNTIEHNNQNIERILLEIEQLKTNDETAQQSIITEQEHLELKEKEKTETDKNIAEITEKMNNLIAESDGYSQKIEELVLSLNKLSGESSDVQVKMVSAQTALEEIASRKEAINENKQEINEQLEKDKEEFKQLEKDREDLEETINSLKNSLDGYKKRYEARQESLQNINGDIDKLNLDIEDFKRRVQMWEELEKNMDGFNFAVKSVMNAKKDGKLQGIHGPVVRLINVDKEFSVAVETALGNKAQNIVVNSENDAKRAISILKEEKAGRATFLPISSIEGRYIDESKLEKQYGFIGIASDLCDCDEKYRSIVVSLLGRTIVAEDLDSAVAIAKKFEYKYKVVSLDGQVVNAGGSLTGGSLSKHSGLLSRANDIEELKKKIAKLQDSLNSKKDQQSEAETSLEAVNNDIVNMEAEHKSANDDLIMVLGEMRRVDGLIQTGNQNIQNLDKELSVCFEREKTNELIIKDSKETYDNYIIRQNEIQTEIDGISGGRDSLTEKRSKLSDELTMLKLRSATAEKDIESIKRNMESLRQAVSDRAYRVDQLHLEKQQFEEMNKNILLKIEELKVQILNFKDSATKEIENIEKLRIEREQAEQRNGALRNEEKGLLTDKENLNGELVRLEERKSSMMREYDEIIKKLYDEYELTRGEAEELNIVIEDVAVARKDLAEIKGKIRALGDVNVNAIEEFKEVSERYEYYKEQIEDLEKSREELFKLIGTLTHTMKDLFIEGFEKINRNFSKTFTDLFGGGSAELTLSDPENVLESGIDISVRIPGKTVSKIEPLSGGEKALVAISIYFAIMMVSPPPFCLLDEVESALDEVNVDRVAEYMHRMNDSTQFICITHRRGTMEAADMLYGVTMQEKGVSKLLEINVSELEKQMNIK